MSQSASGQVTALFEQHHRAVLSYAARRVGTDNADDVAAETFIIAMRAFAQGREVAGLPWLLTTARNVIRNQDRGELRRSATEIRTTRRDDSRAASTPEAQVVGNDTVARALRHLSPPDRELLMLVVWDQLTLTEAAQVLGRTAGATRVRWLRARRKLAAALAAEDAEPVPAATLHQLDPAPDVPRSSAIPAAELTSSEPMPSPCTSEAGATIPTTAGASGPTESHHTPATTTGAKR